MDGCLKNAQDLTESLIVVNPFGGAFNGGQSQVGLDGFFSLPLSDMVLP